MSTTTRRWAAAAWAAWAAWICKAAGLYGSSEGPGRRLPGLLVVGVVGRCGPAQQFLQLEPDAVAPAEPDHVVGIPHRHPHVGIAGFHVVLFADRAVLRQRAIDGCAKRAGDALRIVAETVAVEPRDDQPVDRRPAEGCVPLCATAIAAHREAPRVFKQRQLAPQCGGLF